jgi:hypothetical protein
MTNNNIVVSYDLNNLNGILCNNQVNAKNVKIGYIPANKLFECYRFNLSESVDCSICLEKIKKDKFVVKMKCGHIFHKYCLFNWIDISKKTFCPNCLFDEF